MIRLKRTGVNDSTTELMLKGDGDAGVGKTKDGWIVHTTETREPTSYSDERYYDNRLSDLGLSQHFPEAQIRKGAA